MAYTADPSTDEGRLRILIFDTSTESSPVQGTHYLYSDDDLTNILDLNSDDLWAAAADLCRSMAAKYGEEAFDLGLGKGDIKLDRRKKAETYLKLADKYQARSGSDVVEYIDSYAYGVDSRGTDQTEYIGED